MKRSRLGRSADRRVRWCQVVLAGLAASCAGVLAQNATGPSAPVPAASPAASAAASPAAAPDILTGLENLSLAPPDSFADVLASPQRTQAGSNVAGFAGLNPPEDPGTQTIRSLDNVIRQSDPVPTLPEPDTGSVPIEPALGSPGGTQPYLPQSPEFRPLGSMSAPEFLRARHSIPIGSGRVRYGAQVNASIAYNNNIFGTGSNPQGDTIFALQPSIYVEAGKKGNVRFLWAPSVLKYAKFRQYDTINQAFVFSSRYRLTKLQLGLDASYITQSGLFLNSQGQARQQSLFARLFAEYPLARKVNWSMALEGSSVQSDPGGSQFSGTFKSAIDYRYSRKTQIGMGVEFGQQSSSGGLTAFQTFLLRLAYNPTSKLTIRADGGLQYRQSRSESSGSSSASTTVMSVLLTYAASEKTNVGLRFFRNVSIDSFSPDNIQTTTAIEASLLWQITRRASFQASLSGGYVEQQTLGGLADGSYYFTQGSLSLNYLLTNGMNVQVFNNFQQKLRDTQGGNYLSNTSGMAMGMRF